MTEDLNDTNAEKFKDLRDAKPWHDMLKAAETVFGPWNDVCDNVDKQYASLEKLRGGIDREFQIYWANMETLLPSIYARPPQPVVVPRFKDRKELPRKASEVLERALVANAELDNVHRQYISARNDVGRSSRGVLWARYDIRGGKYEYACLEHLNRKDFLHEPARSWPEVGWVSRRSWMNKDKGIKRFGEEFLKATFSNTKTDTPEDYTFDKKAEVFEIWHKDLGVVCWVTPGYDKVLDISEPHLNFDGFFPCPEPAYGTREPDSLIPVPDFLFYKDQIEEINTLTARIAALSERLKMKGFYPAGAENLSVAIEKVWRDNSEGATLVGVPGMAASGQAMDKAIVWLPVREVAETIVALVTLRKQLIEDVYQITGISDIMRGSTAASETATAQQLKSQYGSVRVRERQAEMIRLCRDGTALQAEIIAEHFQPETIKAMTQTDLPDAAMIQQQVQQATMQLQQAPPDQQQAMQAQLQQMSQAVTFDAVIQLLRDERLRPFILDIETDSTIQPDEDAEKQRRAEFVQVLSGLLGQALPLLQAAPEAADFVGEVLQFGTSPFRAGRSMEGAIDDLVEKIKEKAKQPPPPSPEAQKAEAEGKRMEMQMQHDQQKMQAEGQRAQMDAQMKQADAQAKAQEIAGNLQVKQIEAQARMAEIEAKSQHDQAMQAIALELKQADLQLKAMDLELAAMRITEAEKRANAPQPERAN